MEFNITIDVRDVLFGAFLALMPWIVVTVVGKFAVRNRMRQAYVKHFDLTPTRRDDFNRREVLRHKLVAMEALAATIVDDGHRTFLELELREAVQVAVYFQSALVLQYQGSLAKYLTNAQIREYRHSFQRRLGDFGIVRPAA